MQSLITSGEQELTLLRRRSREYADLEVQVESEREANAVLTEEQERLCRQVNDLATLTLRLVAKLQKAAPSSDLPERAIDYLRRHDLLGSPLRSEHGTNAENSL